MSKIGKQPILIPDGVSFRIEKQKATIQGPKGEISITLPLQLSAKLLKNQLLVSKDSQAREAQALWGLYRTLLANAVQGVLQGFRKELEMVGIGFKAQLEGEKLKLDVGYSHPIFYTPPPGVKLSVGKKTIAIEGIDKQLVGQVAARIRTIKKPEPYKGKGIRYLGEEVKLKPGKAGKAVGTGAK